MKLPGIFRKLTQALGLRPAAQEQAPAVQKQRFAGPRDGFEAARRNPVDLGKVPSASREGDEAFVKDLYKNILKREPDAEGFKNHMKGLENGVSHKELRASFLASPEYRAMQQTDQSQVRTDATTPAAPEDTRNTETKWTDFANQHLGGAWTGGAAIPNELAKNSRFNLGPIAEAYNKATGGNAKPVGEDKLDFGDGRGPVDVIRGIGENNESQFWFGSPQGGKPNPVMGPKGPAGTEPGPMLNTVPWNSEPMWSELSGVKLPQNDPNAAMLAAATWVRDNKSELLPLDGRPEIRAKQYESMTWVIGLMRANGYDATRTVNHPSFPTSNPVRVGSDSLVLNGKIYDVFRASTEPQVLPVGTYSRNERE